MHRIYLVRRDSTPVYVGYTSKSLDERWYYHLKASKTPKVLFHYAIRKYGADIFSIEVLYESEDRDHTLNYMEHHYIWLHRTNVNHGGYNLTLGGEGYTKAKTMSDKQYMVNYYKENKDKRKAYQKTYTNANKEKIKSYNKAYIKANREKKKAYDQAYAEANREKIKERQRNAYQKRKKKAQINPPDVVPVQSSLYFSRNESVSVKETA